ncbi:MAG: transcription antitermination factor NusB, partial [Gemmatimonadales bacterium]|nr:transcription antitermination factor NusB [Gemmatimonadales bacterium]
RPETRARARALQLLYAWETAGHPPIASLLAGIQRLTRPDRAVIDRAADLVTLVLSRREELDGLVTKAAEHWRIDRLAVVDRNILRLGTAEFLEGRVPPKVVIDEALWLAHRFGAPQSPAFINGVLDAVGRSLGRLA